MQNTFCCVDVYRAHYSIHIVRMSWFYWDVMGLYGVEIFMPIFYDSGAVGVKSYANKKGCHRVF